MSFGIFTFIVLFTIIAVFRLYQLNINQFNEKVVEKYQQVNVGRVTVRIFTKYEIFDVLIQGRAVYAGHDHGILVEDAQKMFSRWREDSMKQGCYRIETDRWISIFQVENILLLDEVEYYENIRIH